MRTRIYGLVWLSFIGFSFLGARLAMLMLFPHGDNSKTAATPTRVQAEMEHLHLYRVDDGRGRILYRSGLAWSGERKPVTGAHSPSSVVTNSVSQRETSRANPTASKSLAPSAALLHQETNMLPMPAPWAHDERTRKLKNPVIGTIGLPDRWPTSQRHVEEQGRSGLEYTFDSILRRGRPAYLGTLDEQGTTWWQKRIFWLRPRHRTDIRTTIDSAWQKQAETALHKQHIADGAVVVLDVKTRDVLAMASASDTAPTVNQAVRAQIPGSVFKIVTATAAWDSYRHSPRDRFYCSGVLLRPGMTLHCWRQHGEETLLQAFAQSCNTAFATLGMEAGDGAMTEAARRLGLFRTGLQQVAGHSVLPQAEPGHLFTTGSGTTVIPTSTGQRNTKGHVLLGVLAHTAIGQQDVRMSPLQGANLAATIASGGMYQDAQLVLDAERHGKILREFRRGRQHRAVSRSTAAWIALAMHLTSHSKGGTAADLATADADAAVKTGTAQLPQRHDVHGHSTGSIKVVNSWMVGFAPYRDPQIAFAVFVGHQRESTGHRQVHGVTKDLLHAYMQFQPRTVIG